MRAAVLLVATALAMLAVLVFVVSPNNDGTVVLDDKVQDPLADLDTSVHAWTGAHKDGYDPEKQNVWKDDDAFTVPFVGYAAKDLHWRAPGEPENNVLDYMDGSKFSQPKSMELRALLGPYPPDENVWGSGVTLAY